MIKNFVMEWQKETTCGKNTSEKLIRMGTTRTRPRRNRKNSCYRSRLKRVGNRLGRTDEQWCMAHFSSCCFFGSLGPFRFAAQNLRIPVIPNSVNLFQQQLVFDSFFRDFVFDVTAHCHQQCASAHLANSASPISFNRLFSWGHDPITHACKARPLTVVGWTSLSVIVVVIVVVFFYTSTMFVARRPATQRFRFVHSVFHGTLSWLQTAGRFHLWFCWHRLIRSVCWLKNCIFSTIFVHHGETKTE